MVLILSQVVIMMLINLRATVGTHLSHCDPADTITVCEWKYAKIPWGNYCPFNQRNAVKATWGRTDNITCVDRVTSRYLQNTDCQGDPDLAVKAVTDWCNNNLRSDGKCKIRAAVRKLRIDDQPYDPCPGTFKYLTLCHYCETPVCDSNPCQNGGVCQGGFEDYICACPQGYTGDNCEHEMLDACDSNPCQNGGVCQGAFEDYTCTCPQRYTGDNCEGIIHGIVDGCVSNPCLNGGYCFVDSNYEWGYTCSCPEPLTGKNCEDHISNYYSHPCQNYGRCDYRLDGYDCDCLRRYTGQHCEIKIEFCELNPCKNGGSCVDDEYTSWENYEYEYTCDCRPGTTGIHCETIIDNCVSQPCQKGRHCANRLDGYDCLCPHSHEGQHCEKIVDGCVSKPCLNGGSCVVDSNYLWERTCSCLHGYSGENCEQVIDSCVPNPCQNDGHCLDHSWGYTCFCNFGHVGQHCEIDCEYWQHQSLTSGLTTDSFSASSTLSEEYAPSGVYNNGTYWSPAVNKEGEWVQVRFPSSRYICEIDIDLGTVTKYQIAASRDCQTLYVIKDQDGYKQQVAYPVASIALCVRFIIDETTGWPYINIDYFGVILN